MNVVEEIARLICVQCMFFFANRTVYELIINELNF